MNICDFIEIMIYISRELRFIAFMDYMANFNNFVHVTSTTEFENRKTTLSKISSRHN